MSINSVSLFVMLFSNLHKWLFSIALITSVVSISGYTSNSIIILDNPIELLVGEKPVSKKAVYYFGIANSLLNNWFEFSFNTLLKDYNSANHLQLETVKIKALQYIDYIQFKALKHSINKGDYNIIFIG